jgi:hypothetical protein
MASLPDYIDIPNDTTDHNLFATDVHIIEAFDIPKARKSSDVQRNNHGSKILNLCNNTNISTTNGRIGPDKNVGDLTCKKCKCNRLLYS